MQLQLQVKMCEIYHLLVECGIIYASASLASSSACLAAAIAASLATIALVLGVVNTVSEAVFLRLFPSNRDSFLLSSFPAKRWD